jgi:hypothetical protein
MYYINEHAGAMERLKSYIIIKNNKRLYLPDVRARGGAQIGDQGVVIIPGEQVVLRAR